MKFTASFILVLTLAACTAGGGAGQKTGMTDLPVNSFEACLIYGGVVMESYPRQCVNGKAHFTEDISIGHKGERKTILFEIGPNIVDCTGESAQKCLVVNGEYFYDKIEGYAHKPGLVSIIEIERRQSCAGDMCPQDAAMYEYKLLRIVSER
ncbi:MAG: DUF4377 domain-containing protein [Robiginitomaculum sp.]